jgi:rRNA maturation endonuclease Nob1
MAIEKLYCKCCKTAYSVEWDEDVQIDYAEPDFCPMCGNELADDYYDEEYDE